MQIVAVAAPNRKQAERKREDICKAARFLRFSRVVVGSCCSEKKKREIDGVEKRLVILW